MKIMSRRTAVDAVGFKLNLAEIHLRSCIISMQGKYGTSNAVSNLKTAIGLITKCTSNDKWHKEFYQQFRNPPNTPKSRRLGWHKAQERNEQ